MFFCRMQAGVDIQPDGLRCVVGAYRGKRYYIKKIYYQALHPALFMHGQLSAWSELRPHLQACATQLGLKNAVAVALPREAVRLQALQLPLGLRPADIQAEIDAQLQRDLPGLQERLASDFVVSSQPSLPGFSQIVFAAAKENILTPYLDGFKAAGLNINIVDIDVYALKRAVFANHQGTHLVLQVSVLARLIIYKGSEIVFYEQQGITQALLDWLLTALSAVQHLSIDHYYLLGAASDISQILDETRGLYDWLIPACYEFLPAGFEVAYGLALRAGNDGS